MVTNLIYLFMYKLSYIHLSSLGSINKKLLSCLVNKGVWGLGESIKDMKICEKNIFSENAGSGSKWNKKCIYWCWCKSCYKTTRSKRTGSCSLYFFNEKYLQNLKYDVPSGMYFSFNFAWDFIQLGFFLLNLDRILASFNQLYINCLAILILIETCSKWAFKTVVKYCYLPLKWFELEVNWKTFQKKNWLKNSSLSMTLHQKSLI